MYLTILLILANEINIIIKPYRSGHSLGGSSWLIEANCVNFLYMTNFNIK